MVSMAQRTSAEVFAILAEHEGLVTIAWVTCAEPGCHVRRELDPTFTDEELAEEVGADGWLLEGGLLGVRCPEHAGGPVGKGEN